MEPRVFTDAGDTAARWDAIVARFPACTVLHSHAWGEARRTLGWRLLRVIAGDEEEPVAALATLWRGLPGLGGVAYAPRGPLLTAGAGAAAALGALVDLVRRRTHAAFLRISPATVEPGQTQALAAVGFTPLPDLWTAWNTARLRMRLPLDRSEDGLLAAMAKARRRRLRHGADPGVTVDLAPDPAAAMDEFRRLLAEHARARGYLVPGPAFFATLIRLVEPDRIALVLGRSSGRLLGAQLGLRFGAEAHALYAPLLPDAAGTNLNELMTWQWVRWAKAAGCRTIDFGASGTSLPPRPTDRHYGIYQFKRELGCELVVSPPYQDVVFSPARYRLFRLLERRALPSARRLLGHLPRVPLPRRAAA